MSYKKLNITTPILVIIVGNSNSHGYKIGEKVYLTKTVNVVADYRGFRYCSSRVPKYGSYLFNLRSMDFVILNNKAQRRSVN